MTQASSLESNPTETANSVANGHESDRAIEILKYLFLNDEKQANILI
ncbi:hypothetical protein [Ruegeria sp. A3M17]|nr:hypothetical protein [Ruegeria sp. A3M17]